MGEPNLEQATLKAETVIKLLDLIVHESTSPEIRENALMAYRRLSHGMAPSVIFGDDCEILLMEEEYEERYAQQTLESTRLKAEIRRLNKALTDSKRRQAGPSRPPSNAEKGMPSGNPPNNTVHSDAKGDDMENEGEPMERPDMVITDIEWAAIQAIVPPRYRNISGRERIATLIVVLGIGPGRTKHPWRVLRTPEKPEGWTTFYNQHSAWQRKGWWNSVVATLSVRST